MAPNVPPLGRPYAERQCCGGPQEALQWMLKMQTAPQVGWPLAGALFFVLLAGGLGAWAGSG